MNDRTDQSIATDQRIPTERGDVAAADSPAQRPTATATQTQQTEAQRTEPQRTAMAGAADDDAELLPRAALDDFRTRWDRVQVMFVDQPRDAVQQAHDLVDEVVARMTESFSKQRDGLMGTWKRGDDVTTEELRVALKRYHTFFDRLLST